MTFWRIKKIGKFSTSSFKNSVFIIGLPGFAQVGKLCSDFLIKEFKAKPIYEFVPDTLPSFVKLNEDDLLMLPFIKVFHFKKSGRDFMVVTGNFQPGDDFYSYELSNKILDLFEKLHGSELVSLAGIGLPVIPKTPSVYCTSYSKKVVDNFVRNVKVKTKPHSVVGSVLGISGLVVGLSKSRKINAVLLLAETYGHPLFLGVDSSKAIVKLLNKKYNLGVDLKKLRKKRAKTQVKENVEVPVPDKKVNYIG